MKNLLKTLRKEKMTGYGHFQISIEIDGEKYYTVTNNTMAIDAAFDDSYDEEDRSDDHYESQEQAKDALVFEVLKANNIDL